MNNCNIIKLQNENGVIKEYGQIPDLWRFAMLLKDNGQEEQGDQVLQVWHMAHDLKAVIEQQGKAQLIIDDNLVNTIYTKAS